MIFFVGLSNTKHASRARAVGAYWTIRPIEIATIYLAVVLPLLLSPPTLWADIELKSDFRTAFSELPAIDLPCIAQSKATGLRDATNSEAVSIRFARAPDGRAWLVISNDYPWSESFDIQWNGLVPEIVRKLEDSPTIVIEAQPTKNDPKAKPMSSRWRCDIRPYSHGGWELRASEASIVQWQHRAETGAIVILENELTRLSQSLTHLTQFHPLVDTPRHGSFESSDAASAIPPEWLVSLNPSMSWEVSDDVARHGDRALHFRSQQANAVGWIQSPAFALPDGGRVAAEAWLHLDPAYPRPKIVATTTLLRSDGSRQDWKQTYQQNYVVDKNQEWHRIDFPTLNSAALGTSVDEKCRVRLALDIEGPTQLWIDDICASRIFLDEEERRKLRSQLFVAQRELGQNRPAVAWQLTQTEVSRYVLENAIVEDSVAGPSNVATFEDLPTLNGAATVRRAERQPLRRKIR